MKNTLFLFCALAFLITSCDSNTVFDKNDDNFPQFRWEKDREVKFEPAIEDISVPYDISLKFRHVNGFQFRDMRVEVVRTSPSGKEVARDFNFPVIDSEGEYLSSCALDICDLQTSFEDGVIFEESGKYIYTVRHLMPPDPLPNVMEVGLVIHKAGE
ncbi:MAG: gliding motility lipoprotein GldH [Cryomorphaceae bacterium]|nr:gliding motility lipoprotein GldH [Flavobacteriales bacterium]